MHASKEPSAPLFQHLAFLISDVPHARTWQSIQCRVLREEATESPTRAGYAGYDSHNPKERGVRRDQGGVLAG